MERAACPRAFDQKQHARHARTIPALAPQSESLAHCGHLAGLIAGFLYENISETRDRRFDPIPGQLVDIGGYRLHINCTGHGTPTVILDAGLGDSYLSWRKVQPEIAKFARVCSYDRAGLGYSNSSPRPRATRVIAEELHPLLQHAGSPPLILVGHSMAGFDVRLYASLYRSEVAGLVLVDASHPEQKKRFPRR